MRRGVALVVALAALASAGCQGGEPPAADTVRFYLERSIPGSEFRRDSHVRLGRFTLGLVRGVMRLVGEEDRETRVALANIRSVDIASYEVLSLPAVPALALPPRMERQMAADGWYPMVRTREEDAHTWIFVRETEAGTVSNLYIVELDAVELTIVDLAGRLDRVVAEMVADDPDAFLASLDC
jgi:Domain of unknown function (DUF4252)